MEPKRSHLLAVFCLTVLVGCAGGPWKTDDHLVMNHRSTRVFAPQETVPAILYAVHAGADAVDVDLRRTADGVLVCFHDSVVITRECFGPVGLLDWATLSRADMGYEFDPGCVGTPTRILTFEEFVRFCAANDVRFNLQSKVGKEIAADVTAILGRHDAFGLAIDLQGLPRPDRDDYRVQAPSVHTMGGGGDDDRHWMRQRIARQRGRPLRINVEDCRAIADVLDRHGERRQLGEFLLDPLPPLPLAKATKADLAGMLETKNDDRRALAAINEIVRRKDRSMVSLLTDRIIVASPPVQRAASLWALGCLKDTEHQILLVNDARGGAAGEGWVCQAASAWGLGELDTPEAAGVLGQVVEQGIEEVVKDRMGPKYWAALRALEALGRMRWPSAVKVLADTLKTRPANRYVTQTAAAALARQGGGAAIRALVDCLDEDRPPHRREIIWALLRLQPHSLRPVLGTLANTESDVVRRNALRVLGYADEVPPGSAEEILKCLDSSDASVRAEAAWACGKHRIAEAADRLKGLLADADENVRLDAQQALQRLGQ